MRGVTSLLMKAGSTLCCPDISLREVSDSSPRLTKRSTNAFIFANAAALTAHGCSARTHARLPSIYQNYNI
eukprot:jgi/Botrbrau1/8517/Bobra.0029s0021.1